MEELTCKDCQAFILDEELSSGELPGVCILNPPQMVAGTEAAPDGQLEQIVMSAFPKVDGRVTRCMKLIPLIAAILFMTSCAPRENLGGRSILGATWSNFVNRYQYRNSSAFYGDHIVCRTYKNAYQQIVTECN